MKLNIIICSLGFVLFGSCNDEPINITCADPLGSDAITLNDQQGTCFLEKFNNCVWFRLEFSPPELRSVLMITNNAVATIYDAGEVECLSGVKIKPTSGWSFAVAAKLHHGYVIKMEDGTYGRLFIDSWKTLGSTVTEINITRQYAF